MPYKGLHSGGYREIDAAKIKNVAIPEKIRCQSCKKWKGPSQYSNRQLNDLKYKIFQIGTPSKLTTGLIKCRLCTGQQVTELTCTICDETKPLVGFSKAQRRQPDNARCEVCVVAHGKVEPGNEDIEYESGSEDSNLFWPDETSTTADSEGGAPLTNLGQGLNSLTLAQHDSMVDGLEAFRPSAGASSITSENASRNGPGLKAWNSFTEQSNENLALDDGHVWIGQTKNKNHAAGNVYTGYDSHGIGHTRYRPPSTAVSSEILGDIHSAESPWFSSSRAKFPKPSKDYNSSTSTTKSKSEHGKPKYQLHTDDYEDDDDDDPDRYVLA